MPVELNDRFFAQAAGWEPMKHARALLATGKVLSSNWTPPVLKGVVQDGPLSLRSGLVIKSERDIENLCSCRDSRQWGKLCAHSVAVGLHHLKRLAGETETAAAAARGPTTSASAPAARPKAAGKRVQRTAPGAGGEPAEISVILPPNFAQAVERGKVMLCFEAQWSSGRLPLNALPASRLFAFSAGDTALLDAIELIAGGDTPAMLMIGTKDFLELLPALAGHPRVTLGKSTDVTIERKPWVPPLKATLEPSGEITLAIKATGPLPALIGDAWIFQNQTLQPVGLPAWSAGLRPGQSGQPPNTAEPGRRPALPSEVSCQNLWRGPVRLTRLQVPHFLSQEWPRLLAGGAVEANFQLEDFSLAPQSPKFLLHLAGGLGQLQAHLQCAYGVRILTVGVASPDDAQWMPDPASPTRYGTRDLAAERAAQGRLLRAGFAGPDDQGRCRLLGENGVLNFLARDLPKLQKEWTVTLEERLERSTAAKIERIEPRFAITPSGVQWFDLSVSYESADGQKFSPVEIQRLLLAGQSHTRLRNGRIAVIDTGAVEELQEVLLDCSPQQREGSYRLAQTQAGFVNATLAAQGWQAQAPAAWRERALQQSGETKLTCPPLGDLETVLRPYQRDGVAWLCFLRENGFGGILADDMGLGKTLQALAFLRSRAGAPASGPASFETGNAPASGTVFRALAGNTGGNGTYLTASPGLAHSGLDAGARPAAPEAGALPVSQRAGPEAGAPALVICPTSLVFNWVAEAKKFTPQLKVLALHGPARHEEFDRIRQSDLVVTSYALIRRDLERYREFEFDTVVLDEAQHIKNRQTLNAQAVKAIRARHRLVLTGTPLENSVLDLWSIFDFLMPGYLGTAKDFRERYELPIAQAGDAAAQARLGRRLRPFILRRMKADVAKDLPPKIEQVAFCELTDDQRAVYQQVMEASRQEIFAATDANAGRSRMVALTALLRLRQTCCDLRLLKLEATNPATASGKLELFRELLEEVLDGGHRVLVFSQFVSMLTLLREALTAEGVEFCYLDGSTVDRAAVVNRFQSSQVPVFLISLKAGGTGLNLSGADTVIHFDPWWNPAVEAQATDRAHRIGQTRVVTSYKLITRDTVEEKILALQNRKRGLIQSTLGGEEQFVEALTWEEIQELFTA